MDLYFDPTPLFSNARGAFRGQWSDRKWLNVPGPFYAASTEEAAIGHLHAPGLVLLEFETFGEYVYRQPRTPDDVTQLIFAAEGDPYSGYGCDGDAHWTPAAVREWWRDRGRISEYLQSRRADWETVDSLLWLGVPEPGNRHALCINPESGVAAAAKRYAAYIDGELAEHLRLYLFWLEEQRSPVFGERLPEL